jgi:hypothetical protein
MTISIVIGIVYLLSAHAVFVAGITVWLAKDLTTNPEEASFMAQSCALGAPFWPLIVVGLLCLRHNAKKGTNK